MNGVLSRFTRLQRRLRERVSRRWNTKSARYSRERVTFYLPSLHVHYYHYTVCSSLFSPYPPSILFLFTSVYILSLTLLQALAAHFAVPVRKNFARERLVVMNWLLWIFQLYYFLLFFLLGSQCLVVRCLDAVIPSIRRHKITSNGCEHFRVS